MKRKTEGVTERILEAAKSEFLQYGYSDASIRRISAACNVSTHSIYTRYAGKEELFEAIVGAAATGLCEVYGHAINAIDEHDEYAENEEKAVTGTDAVLEYIYSHFDEFRLIICKSAGTKYEHYLDELAKTEEASYRKLIDIPETDESGEISFFIHAVCSQSFKPIEEVVSHNLSLRQAKGYMKYQQIYSFGGWEAIAGALKKLK